MSDSREECFNAMNQNLKILSEHITRFITLQKAFVSLMEDGKYAELSPIIADQEQLIKVLHSTLYGNYRFLILELFRQLENRSNLIIP